jgi:hypothetical protein
MVHRYEKRHVHRFNVGPRYERRRDHRFNVGRRRAKPRNRRFNVGHQQQLRLNSRTNNRRDNRNLVVAVVVVRESPRNPIDHCSA